MTVSGVGCLPLQHVISIDTCAQHTFLVFDSEKVLLTVLELVMCPNAIPCAVAESQETESNVISLDENHNCLVTSSTGSESLRCSLTAHHTTLRHGW
jgi:hypothetical protein